MFKKINTLLFLKLNDMKKIVLSAVILFLAQNLSAQSLNKMQWFNEPEKWEIKNNALIMNVTANSDYWRISH